MKKNLLTLILSFSVISVFAQKDSTKVTDRTVGRNEIRLNLLNTIIGIPEISYERIFNDNSGAGLSILFGIDDNTDYKLGAIPYYRVYFGNNNKMGTGFFIEANAAVMQVEDDRIYLTDPNGYAYSYRETNVTSFGLGAAAGGKFLTKNGFVGEVYLGAGRFFNKKNYVEAYPRIGITIGKRF
ncbi:hypothetical protein [Pedobacter xixiisoli]|uniref:DUF3575 domain-containing protein n=1 Tax=Pedobacter xixiisoli TaxID=1476464 RepID=A0A285ZSW8_9SPHI|nr:hypothetical protein [Pedobacter xixiisoli]SOD12728.1 hypothetical protein SAMN06297358_0817 [Pedobacter xixiisoli]